MDDASASNERDGRADSCTYSHLAHANDLEPALGHRRLRECPVHHEAAHDPPFSVVSRHDDVLAMLREPEVWHNHDGPGVFFQEDGVLGSADNPDHRRHRGVLRRAFSPSTIAGLEAGIEVRCAQVWDDAFAVDGEGDFVERFAVPFPAQVIGELLGVAPEDRDRFGDWSAAIVTALGNADMTAYHAATEAIWAYVDRMVDERVELLGGGEAAPADVVTILTEAMRAGEIDRSEVRRLSHQLLVAGHETTTSLIGLMLYRLIELPSLVEQLRDEPSLIDVAVEEFLRFDSPVQGLFRTADRPAVVAGATIPARHKVQVLYASANRDPNAWDSPDEIRFDRPIRDAYQHLAFGWGTHYCIGAPLARIQARHALRRMATAFDEVVLTGLPTSSPAFVLRGFTHLPIRWKLADVG